MGGLVAYKRFFPDTIFIIIKFGLTSKIKFNLRTCNGGYSVDRAAKLKFSKTCTKESQSFKAKPLLLQTPDTRILTTSNKRSTLH